MLTTQRPTSMKAIEFLQSTSMRKDKWLVLGDMLELGDQEQQFHEELAKYIDENRISRICLFGPRMEWLYHKIAPRFSGRILHTKDDYGKIVDYIKQHADKDSLILIKGSRGMKLETIINTFNK